MNATFIIIYYNHTLETCFRLDRVSYWISINQKVGCHIEEYKYYNQEEINSSMKLADEFLSLYIIECLSKIYNRNPKIIKQQSICK